MFTRRSIRHICVPSTILTMILTMVLTLSIAGCKGKREKVAVVNEEEAAPKVAMTLKMGDPKASAQLLSGFYTVENGSWRWTSGKFSVMLRPPANGPQAGATLKFTFAAPEVVMTKIAPVTLTASIGVTKLKSETYKEPGNYTYAVDVPATLLAGEAVKVDFALDKSLPPGGADKRELALIAISVAFEAK